jgi:hypothetical protein
MAIAAIVRFLMVLLSRTAARLAVRAWDRIVRKRAQFNLPQGVEAEDQGLKAQDQGRGPKDGRGRGEKAEN